MIRLDLQQLFTLFEERNCRTRTLIKITLQLRQFFENNEQQQQ